MVVYVLVGGLGSFFGPVLGAVILVMIPELFRGLEQYTPYAFAFVLILVIFVIPNGFIGLVERLRARVGA